MPFNPDNEALRCLAAQVSQDTDDASYVVLILLIANVKQQCVSYSYSREVLVHQMMELTSSSTISMKICSHIVPNISHIFQSIPTFSAHL